GPFPMKNQRCCCCCQNQGNTPQEYHRGHRAPPSELAALHSVCGPTGGFGTEILVGHAAAARTVIRNLFSPTQPS
ncbi:hypothetical protein, partial [Chryseobacterium sp. SIMBA_028]|uniref:hypothetical protein n=1 Tax=Chryseobacterium sp. SIMBA_028 TaxID=3085771 RepID=UPI003979B0E9